MAEKITLTKAAVVGGAGLLAYQFLYKPWKAAQDAAATPLLPWGGGGGSGGGSGLPYVTTPSVIPSNLSPGAAVGGPVGACMFKKGWTQSQCETRLNGLVAAHRDASAELAKLKSGQSGADVLAALASTRAALERAMPAYNAAVASGNAAAANQYKALIDGLNSDIRDLEGRSSSYIAGNITKWETAIAGYRSDYLALTGFQLA